MNIIGEFSATCFVVGPLFEARLAGGVVSGGSFIQLHLCVHTQLQSRRDPLFLPQLVPPLRPIPSLPSTLVACTAAVLLPTMLFHPILAAPSPIVLLLEFVLIVTVVRTVSAAEVTLHRWSHLAHAWQPRDSQLIIRAGKSDLLRCRHLRSLVSA